MSTSALAYNPAALVAGRLYHIEGLVDYMPDMKTVALGGAVVDSSTGTLGAGLALRGFVSGKDGLGGIDGRLALALPISDGISVGVSGRYLNLRGDVMTASGVARDQRLTKGFTMDASLRVAPIPEVQLDIAAYNFIDRHSSYVPILLGAGAAFALAEVAVIGADLLIDSNSFNKADVIVGGGIEVFAGRTVPLRIGYSYDSKRQQNTLSFGLGYTDKAFGFDLSLRQELGGGGDTRLMAAVRFYVQ
jgi:hypothetical protein